ncbi:Hypothetical protein UVM_LOCUS101 [uncultured virus]|nr:Hypothetical protein UVM_LOCUS101 [uncultured virus]
MSTDRFGVDQLRFVAEWLDWRSLQAFACTRRVATALSRDEALRASARRITVDECRGTVLRQFYQASEKERERERSDEIRMRGYA